MVGVKDGAACAGLVMIGVGCWIVSIPLSLIVVGSLLLGGAIWGHLHEPIDKTARPSEDGAVGSEN